MPGVGLSVRIVFFFFFLITYGHAPYDGHIGCIALYCILRQPFVSWVGRGAGEHAGEQTSMKLLAAAWCE
jgi:hypothetical protein|eukprot:6590998-Prymnesium_polylepis.1